MMRRGNSTRPFLWWCGGVLEGGEATGPFAPRARDAWPRRVALSTLAAVAVIAAAAVTLGLTGSTWEALTYPAELAVPRVAGLLALAALAAWAVAVVYAAWAGPGGGRRLWLEIAVDMAGVFALSAAVRYGLATANVLTDGGSGFSRVAAEIPRYQAVPILIRALLTASQEANIFASVAVVRALAALGPPLLVALGRSLGLGRRAAALAGVLYACWPLHAAMGSSDSLEGATLSIALLGFALVAAAPRLSCPAFAVTGILVFGFAIWGRPESPLLGLPLLGILAIRAPWSWVHPATAAAGAWIAFGAVLHTRSPQGLLMPPFHPGVGLGGFPWRELALDPAILPAWIWLPLPFGLALLQRRAAVVIVLGLLAGIIPPYLFFPWHPAETYTEVFRYGAATLPFAALASATALSRLTLRAPAWLSRFTGSGSTPYFAAGVTVLVAAPILVTPLVERVYLARRYGPTEEITGFARALRQVPSDCALVVPDDEGGGYDEAGGVETLRLFRSIARGVAERGRPVVAQEYIVGTTAFLDAAGRAGGLPRFAALAPDRDLLRVAYRRAMPPAAPRDCWYFFRGTYCGTGMRGVPLRACDLAEKIGRGEVLWRHRFRFFNYRLVTRPSHFVTPWYDGDAEMRLVRLLPPP